MSLPPACHCCLRSQASCTSSSYPWTETWWGFFFRCFKTCRMMLWFKIVQDISNRTILTKPWKTWVSNSIALATYYRILRGPVDIGGFRVHFWMHLAGKQVMHGGIFLEQALVATPPKARWPASKLDILDNLEKWHWFFFSDMYPLKMETGFMCIYIYYTLYDYDSWYIMHYCHAIVSN